MCLQNILVNLNVQQLVISLCCGTAQETSMKVGAVLATCLHTGFLLGLFFDHEDGGNMVLQNIS
jgi:hypothetical protein